MPTNALSMFSNEVGILWVPLYGHALQGALGEQWIVLCDSCNKA